MLNRAHMGARKREECAMLISQRHDSDSLVRVDLTGTHTRLNRCPNEPDKHGTAEEEDTEQIRSGIDWGSAS